MIIDNVSLDISSDLKNIKSAYHEYSVIFSDKSVSDVLEENDFLLIDRNVDTGITFKNKYVFDAIEDNKNIFSSIKILDEMVKSGFQKNSKLVVVGGGITQDVGALCAAMFKRGIRWVFFPTTLLSMCDSCIGAKCGVNHGNAKNQIGLFYPPQSVIINTNYLSTLEDKDILSGIGEIIKLHQIGGVPYNPGDIRGAIDQSLRIKRSIIEYDEFEYNIRKSLNYGHSFGHVLEVLSNYEIPHGTAVVWGMLIINEYFGGPVDIEFEKMCKKVLTPYKFKFTPEDFKQVLLKDKKVSNNSITLVRTEYGKTSFVQVNVTDAFIYAITSSLRKIQDRL